MFILAIFCLTMSDLTWFVDLTFQVPMQYCALQHQTLLSPPDTGTTEHCVHFGPASSFFLELYLHSSPVAYWTPTDLGSSSFQCPIFLPFYTVHGVLKARIRSGLPFPSPVDHILSELSTMTRPSWVALHIMAHSFIDLCKAVIHETILVSFLWLWFSFWRLWDYSSCFFCLPMMDEAKRLL